MRHLSYTLLSDGTSDRALIPILTWLLRDSGIKIPIVSQWADLGRLPRPPKTLDERIRTAVELYPCDLLFVHRDAERDPIHIRRNEIQQALSKFSTKDMKSVPAIFVVPVRMMEAWLLLDENAIRDVSGNPNGRQKLELPRMNEVETIADPKQLLHQLVRQASELQGRRLHKLTVHAWRIADAIKDFSPLRQLPAFQHLDTDLNDLIRQLGWHQIDNTFAFPT